LKIAYNPITVSASHASCNFLTRSYSLSSFRFLTCFFQTARRRWYIIYLQTNCGCGAIFKCLYVAAHKPVPIPTATPHCVHSVIHIFAAAYCSCLLATPSVSKNCSLSAKFLLIVCLPIDHRALFAKFRMRLTRPLLMEDIYQFVIE